MDFELRIGELLASRLCHALAATVGAVGNGLELVQEFDDSFRDEAMELVDTSAKKASAQLKFFRMAYGFAGYQSLEGIDEVRSLSAGVIDAERIEIDWSGTEHAFAGGVPDGLGKLLLVMIELAVDMLPRGGRVSVSVAESGACEVSAVGEAARVEDQLRPALSATPEMDLITARNVHACYAARLAAGYGQGLLVEEAEDSVRLAFQAASAFSAGSRRT